MSTRKLIRRIFNYLGYDIHKEDKDVSAYFDPLLVQIATAKLEEVTASFFVADPNDTIQSQHVAGSFFEPNILTEIAAHLEPNGCYVDIGANVGNHVLYFAKRFPETRLIAFEPMRRQHAIFTINSLINKIGSRLTIHKSAASEIYGRAQMITPFSGNLGRSMIAQHGYGEWVSIAPADHLLHDEKVSFVKIDVEGHELSALRGLEKTVRRCGPTLLVEVNETNRIEFELWIKRMDYRIETSFKHNDENFEALAVPK